MTIELAERKARLRARARAGREAAHAAAGALAAAQAAAQFRDHVSAGEDRIIAGYWPIGAELDALPMAVMT